MRHSAYYGTTNVDLYSMCVTKRFYVAAVAHANIRSSWSVAKRVKAKSKPEGTDETGHFVVQPYVNMYAFVKIMC